ncbi:MAG: Dyp-type peroxidase [Myxococcales bacterium]|nr:Dyp-type peroxidase [Myxococcales bacterium]
MSAPQPGLLAPLPPASRYLTFRARPGADPRAALARLAAHPHGEALVIGIGASTVAALGGEVPGLREATPLAGPGQAVPATPAALWLWLRGDERGVLLHRGRELAALVADAFIVDEVIDGFVHRGGRDLSGYEDGTENPEGAAAIDAAIVDDPRPGLGGSSFVAVQRWIHDLDALAAMGQAERDGCIGRRHAHNLELGDAPPWAHVKRAAQESFAPPAFILRRSMPWAEGADAGLLFIAFGRSFDAFEAILRRMVGAEDGIVDGLFRFTRPRSSAFLWCPPLVDGRLDLRLFDET